MACITESGFDTNISQVLKVLDLKIPTFLPTHDLRLICSALPMELESFWPHVGKAACRECCTQRTALASQHVILSSPGGRTRVQRYLLLSDSESSLLTLFRRASWRANASYNERRIRANNHALS
jgi:hypothetical protein